MVLKDTPVKSIKKCVSRSKRAVLQVHRLSFSKLSHIQMTIWHKAGSALSAFVSLNNEFFAEYADVMFGSHTL